MTVPTPPTDEQDAANIPAVFRYTEQDLDEVRDEVYAIQHTANEWMRTARMCGWLLDRPCTDREFNAWRRRHVMEANHG